MKIREGSGRGSLRARFALPYSFKPQLSLLEAAVAALLAFLRIFLGCLLFAVWGSYTMSSWGRLSGYWYRVPAILGLAAVFLLAFAFLMFSIAALGRALNRVL